MDWCKILLPRETVEMYTYEYEYKDLAEDTEDLYTDTYGYEYTENIEWQDYYHNLTQELEIIE
jgi:hypothetical protein